jgi:hypothetical protein
MANDGQRKTITQAAKGWAGFFSFLLTILLIPVLFTLTLNFTLFNQRMVKQVLVDQQVYEQLPQTIIQIMVTKIGSESGNTLLSQLDSDQMARLISTLLPEDYFRTQVEMNVDSVFSVLNLETTELNFAVDLQPIKDYLNSTSGQSAFFNYLNTLPECSLDQVAAIIQATQESNPTTTITLCKLPEEAMQLAQPVFSQMTVQFSESLPDKINLASKTETGLGEQITSSIPYQIYKSARQIMDILPWIIGLLVVVIVLLTLRSIKTMLKLLGIPMIISGVVSGFGAFLFGYGGSALIPPTLFANGQLGEMFKQIVMAMITEVGHFGLLLSLFSAGVGFIFLIIAGLLQE